VRLALARYWWVLALRGLLTLVFGLLIVLWPDKALATLALFFGAYMLVDGLFAVGAMLSGHGHGDRWYALLLEGITGVVIGILTLLNPWLLVVAVVYLIAAWAIVTGVFQIVEAIQLRRYISGEFWLILTGLLSVLFGVVIAFAPDVGEIFLAAFLGGYAIIAGILLIGLGFQLRSWQRGTVEPAPPP
jgi:uncharacterized membrane protein HdeD (DUF308 family)